MSTFHALATEFEVKNAIFLAKLSELAYLDELQIKTKLQLDQDDTTKTAFIHANLNGFDTEVVIMAEESAIIVVFRGTEINSIEDWISNIDNRMFPIFMGNVHQGFWEALGQVWEKVNEKLAEFRDKNQPIWLTGHSQGGALAMLAARVFKEQNIDIQGVYTFGQPRTGDMLFASNYDAFLQDKTFRIYNDGDSIVENPQQLYHAGIGVKISENGEINIHSGIDLTESSGSSLASVLDALLDFVSDGINPHTISEYIKRLEK
ncbi:MAG: lipase family protein [Cytophagia bacterium]|nr:MAG: lipase family protein [Cytophagia bacterium]TAG42572.1 MAG: lipase family protein [Cytophagia bacterium]